MQIGIAGLGRMGAAVAARLMEGGTPSRCGTHTRQSEAVDRRGRQTGRYPEDLASTAMSHYEATDADAIDHVYNGEHGLLAETRTTSCSRDEYGAAEIEISLAKVVRASGGASSSARSAAHGPARQGKLFGFMGAEPGDAELAKPSSISFAGGLSMSGRSKRRARQVPINMPRWSTTRRSAKRCRGARHGAEPERLMDSSPTLPARPRG